MKLDITLEQLVEDYDWGEVFGEGSGGNCDKQTDAIPDSSDIDTTPPMRADVVEIIAAVNGENDGDSWIGIFRLKDGRYLVADGSCDYTGWDCQAGNSLQVAASLDDILEYGLTAEQFDRLELSPLLVPPGFSADDLVTPEGRAIAADYWEDNGVGQRATILRREEPRK